MQHHIKALIGKGQVLGGAVHQVQVCAPAPDFLAFLEHPERNIGTRPVDCAYLNIVGQVAQVGAGAD